MECIASGKIQAVEHLLQLKSYFIPPISLSHPVKCHRDYKSICNEADEWMFRYLNVTSPEQGRRLAQYRTPAFAAFLVPRDSPRNCALAVCKYAWLFTALDDLIDEKKIVQFQFMDAILGILSDNSAPPYLSAQFPLLKAGEELFPEIRSLMPLPALYSRLVSTNKSWIQAFEAVGTFESVEAYKAFRKHNIFLDPFYILIEMCLGICLSDKDTESHDMVDALDAITDHCWMVNDLFSFAKEYREEDIGRNILSLSLLMDPGINSIQEAINCVSAEIQEKEKAFLYYRSILVKKAQAEHNLDLLRFLDAILAVIPGNIYMPVTMASTILL